KKVRRTSDRVVNIDELYNGRRLEQRDGMRWADGLAATAPWNVRGLTTDRAARGAAGFGAVGWGGREPRGLRHSAQLADTQPPALSASCTDAATSARVMGNPIPAGPSGWSRRLRSQLSYDTS